MPVNQADTILDLLDLMLGPAQSLTLARDSNTGRVIVRGTSEHTGSSVRDALAQYLQTRAIGL